MFFARLRRANFYTFTLLAALLHPMHFYTVRRCLRDEEETIECQSFLIVPKILR